jgi:hypothetical protein
MQVFRELFFLTQKEGEPTNPKEEKPEPEEQEGMPQHCPLGGIGN